MNDNILVSAVSLAIAILAFFIGRTISKLQIKNQIGILEEREKQLRETIGDLKIQQQHIENDRDNIRRQKEQLHQDFIRKNADFDNLTQKNEEQKVEVKALQERFAIEFENLANKILDEKSKKFTDQNKNNLDAILKPLQDKIQSFEKRVEDTNKEDIHRTADLRQQILGLKALNEQMSKETTNLTKALKGDSKMQGNWGEVVLERVLERSGLQKDSEYMVQQSFTDINGRRQMPDVIINLPGNKKIIIDSKVSLVAYERYVNSPEDEDKNLHLKSHLTSIKQRVNELGEKNYHQIYPMESPDFVLLFIPIESAFAVASIHQPSLYADAFERNIIIVTPTTMLAVLKTIDTMWRNENQKANAIEIAQQAGRLYDSFVNLTDELIKVGKQLGTVQNSYDNAMKKLTGKGNLITRVEKLKTLGANTNKHQDQKLLKQAINEEE